MEAIQAMSVVGAILVLGAFVGNQVGRLSRRSKSYNLANVVGSGLLAYIAVVERQLGFILLEVVWGLVSLYALFRPAAEEA